MPQRSSQAPTSTCPLCAGTGAHDLTGRDLMFNGEESYDYHRCTACGLVYMRPIPTSDEIANFYPDSYDIYAEPRQPRFSRRALLTLKHKMGYSHIDSQDGIRLMDRLRPLQPAPNVIPHVPGGKALDVGCGNGEYLLRLKSIGWQCQGVEFNSKAVSICRSHGLEVFHGDLKSAAFEADSFDFVTAHHLIEHVPDPHELMSEISRITKPGGSVLIRTPNSLSLGRRWFGKYWFANDVPRHLYLYSLKNLVLLASSHGLKLVSSSTPPKPKVLLRSFDYLTGNTGKPYEKRRVMRWLSKLYTPAVKLTGRGDELSALFEKEQS